MTLPRDSLTPSKQLSLEVFSDASAIAKGMCVYLRDGDVTSLLLAKYLMASHESIPRLELDALLSAMELTLFHIATYATLVRSITFCSDSTTVLQWIYSHTKPSQISVVNRLVKMRSIHIRLSQQFKVHYAHTDGLSNPADIASRGVPVSVFSQTAHWWETGLPRPKQWSSDISPYSAVELIRPPDKTQTTISLTAKDSPGVLEDSHSSYRKFLIQFKARAVLLKLLYGRLPPGSTSRKRLRDLFPFLDYHHMSLSQLAEILAVRTHQREEGDALIQRSHHLDLATDEWGLTCVRGRFPHSSTHPWLINEKSPLAKLIFLQYHTFNSHTGGSTVLARVRSRFWPIPAKRTLRSLIKGCVFCKKWAGRPFQRPPFKALPPSRTEGNVWERVGLDEAGPFRISSHTRYVLLVTCFVTRAVHAEVLADTSAAELSLALRRFFASYRVPSVIYLDNLSSHCALKKWIESREANFASLPPTLGDLTQLYRISFLFITPLSPWKGGMYERMIGLLKGSLKKMGNFTTSLSMFHTVIMEAALLVNSRPLTPLNEEGSEVITPRHFLFPYRGTLGVKDTYTIPENITSCPKSLIMAWRELNKHITQLWQCWSEEYLQALRERNTVSQNSHGRAPSIGEVVLCTEMVKDRRKWHLGMITDLRRDADGYIRSVVVRHPDRKTYARPPEALIPLELQAEEQ